MSEGNSERRETDPAILAQQLEIELMMKRAAWQQAKARRGSWRMLSFAFLFVVVIASLFAGWYLFSSGTVQEIKATTAQHSSPSPTASPK